MEWDTDRVAAPAAESDPGELATDEEQRGEFVVGAVGARLLFLGWVLVISAAYYPRWRVVDWRSTLLEAQAAAAAVPAALAGIVPNFALVAVIMIAAAGYGLIALRPVRRAVANRLDAVLLAATLGLATMSYLVLLVGSLGLLRPRVLWALVAVGLVVLAVHRPWRWAVALHVKSGPRPRRTWLVLAPWLLLIVVQLATNLPGLAVPEIQYDAWHYHLGAPKYYLNAGGIVPLDGRDTPNIWYSNFPFSLEMLYTLGLGLGNAMTGKMIHFVFGILTVLVVYQLGRTIHSHAAGVIGAAIYYLTPLVSWESVTAYNDLGVALYEGLAALAFLRWQHNGDRRWLGLLGLAVGLAVTFKFSAAYLIVAIGLPLAVLWWQRRCPPRALAGQIGLLVLTGGMPMLPWAVKSAVLTGYPLYPVGVPSLFPVFGPMAGTWREYLINAAGVGRSWLDYLLLPWNLTLRGDAFGGAIGPLFLMLVPVVALVRRSAPASRLLAVFALWFAGWAVGSQQLRFLVPGLVLAAPLAGFAVALLLESRGAIARSIAALLGVVVFGLAVLNLPNFGSAWQADHWILRYEVPWRVLNGTITPQQYLEQNITCFRTVNFINSELPNQVRIFALEDPCLSFLYVNRMVTSFEEPFGEGRELRGAFARADGFAELGQRKYTHVFTNGKRQKQLDQSPWRHRLRLIFQDGNNQLYALDSTPLPDPVASLLDRLADARIVPPAGEVPPVQALTVAIGDDRRDALLQHPTSKVTFPVRLADKPALRFATGIRPECQGFGDGVTFKIAATENGQTKEVFVDHLNPSLKPPDRAWVDHVVDLAAWAGKEIELVFITLPGPAGDYSCDQALWGDPQIARYP